MHEYRFEFLKAVDGDTVDLRIDLGFGLSKVERVRLAHVDTPERGAEGYDLARQYVTEWIEERGSGRCTVRTFKKEKFGRYLAEIHYEGQTLNDALVQNGLAKVYDGGTR